MSILTRMFGRANPREEYAPLYAAIVREGRDPIWYADGQVPDTLDGRFDMIAAVLSLVLLRLEAADVAGRAPAALLTELFVEDMDGQLRQIGIGDLVVGKHIGRMMSALGGRLTAYRAALGPGGDLDAALTRNLWRGEPPERRARALVAARLEDLRDRLATTPLQALLAGGWPAP